MTLTNGQPVRSFPITIPNAIKKTSSLSSLEIGSFNNIKHFLNLSHSFLSFKYRQFVANSQTENTTCHRTHSIGHSALSSLQSDNLKKNLFLELIPVSFN